jgi:hypothetical protein
MTASAIAFHHRWIEQCPAALHIKQQFGFGHAREYLGGEELLHFVETTEHDPELAQELPYFAAQIKRLFSLAKVGNRARHIERTKPLSAPQ